jgi:ubiquinone/menaquinone biosynthesis C-methylase UbiE
VIRPATRQDIDAVKVEQRAAWNEVSAGWEAVQDDFERGAVAVTTRLLELAELRPGQVVLDVATGHGEPALTAARLVGPTGRVVGVDIASEMLAIARRRAAGVDNVELIESDLESLTSRAGHSTPRCRGSGSCSRSTTPAPSAG